MVLSEEITKNGNNLLMASREYSIVRQDYNGVQLNKISLETKNGVFLFDPSIYSMFIKNLKPFEKPLLTLYNSQYWDSHKKTRLPQGTT